MDKQNQIEELEEIIESRMNMAKLSLGSMNRGVEGWLAGYLINEEGYRKIPENAVVLTREEYEELQVGKDFNYGYHCGESNMMAYYENIRLPEIRKETAEKFAQALENRLDSIDTILHEDNEEEYLSANELGELIDEICKEITEGKDEKEN